MLSSRKDAADDGEGSGSGSTSSSAMRRLWPSLPMPDHVRPAVLSALGTTWTTLSEDVCRSVAFLAVTSADFEGGGSHRHGHGDDETCTVACHLLGDSDHFLLVEVMFSPRAVISAALVTYRLVEDNAARDEEMRGALRVSTYISN